MAGVTALRDAARDEIFCAGGRGFVRFLSQGDALLVSDAPRRGAGEPLVRALEDAGFEAAEQDGLLYITPGDERLLGLCALQPGEIKTDWESPLFEAAALCERLLGEPPVGIDAQGRRLLIETARLLWRPKEQVLAGLPALRAMIAVRLRGGNRSGFYETGRLLAGWFQDNEE